MSTEKTTVIHNPDGTLAVLEETSKSTSAGGAGGPAASAGHTSATFIPPVYGPGGGVVFMAAPPPPVIVACPRCGQHLRPPPGAPIFACPCGQQMRPPPAAMAPPTMMSFGGPGIGYLSVGGSVGPAPLFGPPGHYMAGSVYSTPGPAGGKAASSGPAHPGGPGAQRYITCGRCRVTLASECCCRQLLLHCMICH